MQNSLGGGGKRSGKRGGCLDATLWQGGKSVSQNRTEKGGKRNGFPYIRTGLLDQQNFAVHDARGGQEKGKLRWYDGEKNDAKKLISACNGEKLSFPSTLKRKGYFRSLYYKQGRGGGKNILC